MCVLVCASVCRCACVRICVRVRACAWVWSSQSGLVVAFSNTAPQGNVCDNQDECSSPVPWRGVITDRGAAPRTEKLVITSSLPADQPTRAAEAQPTDVTNRVSTSISPPFLTPPCARLLKHTPPHMHTHTPNLSLSVPQ